MTYNWTDLLKVADEAGFTPVPIGEYDVIVVSSEAKQTQGGKDSIVVQFQVTNGPHAGRKVRNQFTISPENPNAVGFFFRHMAALGLPREWFNQLPSIQQVAQALLNRPCRIKVNHRDWGGQVRDNVESIMPAMTTPVPEVVTPGVQTTSAPVNNLDGLTEFAPKTNVTPLVAPPAVTPVPTPSPVPAPATTPVPVPSPTPVIPAPPASVPSTPVVPTPVPSLAISETSTNSGTSSPPVAPPTPVIPDPDRGSDTGVEAPPELPL